MRPFSHISLTMLLLAAGFDAVGQAGTFQAIEVSDTAQLLRSIGPDRTLVLRKGDYLLSGRELALSGLQNLSLRGADGARIIGDSAFSSILGIYHSSNITLDNLVFLRAGEKGSEPGAGSLHAESVRGLTLDRCSFEGPTGVAVELRDCPGASIRRSSISGASSGAISASWSPALSMADSRISLCEGYPLVYFEESGQASFRKSVFEKNRGATLVEAHSKTGGGEGPGFEGCSFTGNVFDYFSGSSLLPSTRACVFSDNSFDGSWPADSVAAAGPKGGGDVLEGQGPRWYSSSPGLSFAYPEGWELREYPAQSRVAVFAPDGDRLVLFLDAYTASPGDRSPRDGSAKLFGDSYAALIRLLMVQAGINIFLKAEGEPYEVQGLLMADYKGLATKEDGEASQARARFVLSGTRVQVLIGLAPDIASLDADTDIDAIFVSLRAQGR